MLEEITQEAADRVWRSFASQTFMKVLGAELTEVKAGEVAIELPFSPELCQQHGFLHAGVVTTLIDTACGYAAYTQIPLDMEILSVEFKVNFMAPAVGERLSAYGRVIRSGRTLTITQGDVFAHAEGKKKHIAAMQATMMAVRP